MLVPPNPNTPTIVQPVPNKLVLLLLLASAAAAAAAAVAPAVVVAAAAVRDGGARLRQLVFVVGEHQVPGGWCVCEGGGRGGRGGQRGGSGEAG